MKKTVLFSSAGRRNQLIACFRQDALELGMELRILAADVNPALSPACHVADAAFPVPRCTRPEFIDEVLDLCSREQVDLLVPTIDPELPAYAEHAARFAGVGTRVIVSGPETVSLARNKIETARRLGGVSVTVPRTVWWDELRREPTLLNWPVILKPNDGSGSQGIFRLAGPAEGANIPPNAQLIAQEYIQGAEYTINMFIGRDGRLGCVIPHERLEVRSGEVSKGITRRVPALAQAAGRIASVLNDARGPLCFQAVVGPLGQCSVFEINARFGGGFPLAHRAGARFSRWLLEESIGAASCANDGWREGVTMLRYDSAIFYDA